MSQKKILIVSGDPVLLDLLQKNLSTSGYQVLSVEENDREMEPVLKEGQPDLVIVDIQMPKMEGIKISLSIRKKYDVPIIMLTSKLADKNKVKGLDLSTENHLSDSIDVVQLMEWIKDTFTHNAAMGGYQFSDSRGNGNGHKKFKDY